MKFIIKLSVLSRVTEENNNSGTRPRKVAEGKNKMSVLNAVKNKLLARVVAVVNKQQEYVKRIA